MNEIRTLTIVVIAALGVATSPPSMAAQKSSDQLTAKQVKELIAKATSPAIT